MASLFDLFAPASSGFVDPRLQSRVGPGLFDMTLAGPQVQPIRGSLFDPAMMAPMPQVEAGGVAPQPVQRPGLLSRLGGAFFPTPEGMDGLLSPEALGQARRQGLLDIGLSLLANSSPQNGQNAPPTLAAIAQALQAGRQGYMGGVGGAIQGQQMMAQLAEQQRRQATRQQIEQQYAIAPDDPPEIIAQKMRGMYAAYVNAGDGEMIGKLNSVAPTLFQTAGGATPKLDTVDVGGEKIDRLVYPDGRIVEVGRLPKTPTPRDPNAPDTAAQMRDQRMFQREQQLGDDFNKDTTVYRQGATKIAGALEEAPRALAGDGAAQINMLYAFVNAMDPASAVREGEIGLARAASPVWDQASSLLQKYLSGDKSVVIPKALVQQMTGLMERRYEGYGRAIDERGDYYRGRAKRWGVDAEGMFPGLPQRGGKPTPAKAGSHPLDTIFGGTP